MNAEQAMDTSTVRLELAPGLFATLREDVACVFERDPTARSRPPRDWTETLAGLAGHIAFVSVMLNGSGPTT